MLLLTPLYRGKGYDTLLSKTMQLESISPGIQVWSLFAGLCYCHVLCEDYCYKGVQEADSP